MWDWFIGEAGAAWIIGALTVLGGIYLYIRRPGPNYLIPKMTQLVKPIQIHDSIKERIEILLDGSPIRDLAQVDMELVNSGGKVVRDAKVKFAFAPGVEIIDVTLSSPRSESDIRRDGSVEIRDNVVLVTVDYFNPYRTHRQVEHLSFTLSGDLNDGWNSHNLVSVSGIGPDWSVRGEFVYVSSIEGGKERVFMLIAVVIYLSFLYQSISLMSGARHLNLDEFIAYRNEVSAGIWVTLLIFSVAALGALPLVRLILLWGVRLFGSDRVSRFLQWLRN